ncbi:uncharacterized protein LOC113069650 [Carassius auratus]|uniref:Uncharacterized protein LOC113069650 n=1 Tax=Carassius auratus TaxID=7957 RepID=A0A6P6MQM0_CARAU|nr:uncharacterized protein LOC113069650 [Carassius auratus]
MRILQLHLCLLIWCQTAETLIDQLVHLGQNVTINCDFENEVNWFLLKPPYFSVILRTFPGSPFYYNEHYRQKYSVASKHLFINNVTSDELGVYFCMNTDCSKPQFSNGTRLYITEQTQNYTVVQNIQQNHTLVKYIEQNQTSWQTLTLISGLINAVLVIVVVIGLLKVCDCRNKRPAELSQQLHNTDLQQTQLIQQHLDPIADQSQHAEEDSSMLYTNIHPGQVNSTYVALQLPKA